MAPLTSSGLQRLEVSDGLGFMGLVSLHIQVIFSANENGMKENATDVCDPLMSC